MTRAAVPILSSISGLASSTDAWIVDIWGVMHNGARAFDAAAQACRRFRASGGIVLLLSNAPRPFTAVIAQLDTIGVARDAYDGGVTSGDVAREMIADWQRRPLLHIGPDRDKGLFEGFDLHFAAADAAEAVICSGLYDDTKEAPADYADLFAGLVARKVPMICANPDILVERGEKLIYCAGALAAAYQAEGGEVIYAGKPYLPIYERTLALIDRMHGRPVPKERIVAVGDGLETDLKGAHVAGLGSVFIASAVHVPGGLDAGVLDKLFGNRPFAPLAALPALAW
jgi:HAD superfamily hydrolase (TIGR01459 family)